jgi:[CysO sulfur-carrier protein]-S-L-cysteine hydrolase
MAELFELPRHLYRMMLEHCHAEKPVEACGIFAGEGNRALVGYALTNSKASPIAYRVDDQELASAWQDLTGRTLKLVGIYHSHPTGPATPSRTDIQQATYPEAVYLIVSFADSSPRVGAYRIVGGQSRQISLALTEETACEWIDLRQPAGP